MAGNKKPRKAYRPKCIKGTLPVNIRHGAKAELHLQMAPHQELARLRDGTATDDAINTITFRLNWGYVMASEIFDNKEVRADMEQALAALRSVKDRKARTGKWGAMGPEFQQMGDGLNHTDTMQLKATRREQLEVIDLVEKINALKLAGEI